MAIRRQPQCDLPSGCGSLNPNAPSVIQANEASVELSRFIGRGSRHRSYFLSIMPPSICNTWPVVYVLVIRKM